MKLLRFRATIMSNCLTIATQLKNLTYSRCIHSIFKSILHRLLGNYLLSSNLNLFSIFKWGPIITFQLSQLLNWIAHWCHSWISYSRNTSTTNETGAAIDILLQVPQKYAQFLLPKHFYDFQMKNCHSFI